MKRLILVFLLLSQIYNAQTTNMRVKNLNNIRMCDQFTGANSDARIAACMGDLPSTGGIANALGIEGNQTWAACPFTGVTKPVTLWIGAATYASAVNCTVPSNITLQVSNGGLLSPIVATVITVNGPIVAPPNRIFTGSGTIAFTANYVQKEYWVEWWGATGDVSGDDTLPLQAAFTALPNGSTMRFASNKNYYTTTELVLDHKFQVTLLGNDGEIGYANANTKPQITYRGGLSGVSSTLKLNNCYACTVRGLIIESNDALDLTKGTIRGIWITFTAGGSPSLSSRNKIEYCSIYAYTSQATWKGIDISNASSANNEHHVLHENLIIGNNSGIVNNATIGINLDHAQVKAIEITRNNISNVGTGVSVQGNMRATNNSFNNIYTVWSFGYLLETATVIGDDVETIQRYIFTNQHPGGGTVTFIANRIEGLVALGDNASDYWVKTVGKFTFIDNEFLANTLYNVRPPGPYAFQGDTTSTTYFAGNTIQLGQYSITDNLVGLETMNATVMDGSRILQFGGSIYDFGTRNFQTVPTDYIGRKTINTGGPSNQLYAPMYIGDNEISIAGLYQEYGLTITVVGVTGSTLRRFVVLGIDSLGRKAMTSLSGGPSSSPDFFVGVSNANATLSGSNYLTLSWPSQPSRPPITWSVYEINPANQFEWRLVVNQANVAAVPFQTYNVVANPAGAFTTRTFLNETSEVGINGRLQQTNKLTFTDADTTPSVAIGNRFVCSNTGATNLTTFDDGIEGQIIYVQFTTANTTLKQGGTLKLRTGADTVPAANTLYGFQLFSNVWYQQ